MGLLFKNNAETTLSSGINNSTTTVPVASAAVFPTPNANNVFFATIDDGTNVEVVKVTAISNNDLTVVRAQDNTSAAAFGTGVKIELRLTAKVLETGTTSLTDLDGDTAIFLEQLDDEDNIRFDTSGLQRVLINSAGDVAVGSRGTNPMGLSISGTVLAISEASNVASLQIDGVTGTRIDMGTNSSRNAVFYTDANQLEISRTTDHPIKFVINSGEVARLTSSELKLASGKKLVGGASNVDLTIQSEHRTQILGASKGTVLLNDSGTVYGLLERPTGTNDFDIQNPISDGDITFVGNDGGSTITALTLDMSNSGDAVFRRQITCREAIYINTSDNSATTGYLYDDSGDFVLRNFTQDKDIVFKGNDGGSVIEAMRIDYSEGGRVGIGTSSPLSELHVSDAGDCGIMLQSTNCTDDKEIFQIIAGANPSSECDLVFRTRTNAGTGGTEHMRITQTGNIGIGTSNPGYILDVSGGSGTMARITSGGSSTYLAIANTSNTGYIGIDGTNMAFYPTGTKRGNLDSSGNLVVSGNVTAYGSPSDIRLKENIEVIENALDKVKQLKGITYTLKSDGNRLTGLVAQDLEKVLPEAVYTSETIADERKGEESEEHLAIRYGNTVGLLVEAIKEQQEQIEALTARIKKLEGK